MRWLEVAERRAGMGGRRASPDALRRDSLGAPESRADRCRAERPALRRIRQRLAARVRTRHTEGRRAERAIWRAPDAVEKKRRWKRPVRPVQGFSLPDAMREKTVVNKSIRHERPACFGDGRDASTGQWTPLRICRSCACVHDCATLRLARAAERGEEAGAEYARVYLGAKFPYGRPADRFGGGRRG